MRFIITLLVGCVAVHSQVTISGKTKISGVVSLGGVASSSPFASNTQMLLTYTAPDSTPCTLEVSESGGYTPLVHDLDTALFSASPAANADNRAGNISNGTARQFVIGKRAAEKGSDGHWYSRALQTNTLHYYRLTCSDGAHTGSFVTDNIKIGNTYWESLTPDPNASAKPYTSTMGFYAHPEFTKWDISDSTARQETIIDPKTGLLMKRLAMPRDQPLQYGADGPFNFTTATGSAWTSASNVLVDDGNSATYSGTTSDFLFVSDNAFDNTVLNLQGHPTEFLYLDTKAWCSGGSCTSANATIEVCLTINGTSCWPTNGTAKFQSLILGTSTSPTLTTIGTGCSVPILDCWTPAGYTPLNRVDLKSGGALGWLVRKKSASTDTINIQYLRYVQGSSSIISWPATGSANLCSDTLTQNSVTLGLGYDCVMKTTGIDMLYWVDHVTGDANYLGFFMPSPGQTGVDGFGSNQCIGARTISGTTPTASETVYCSMDDNGQGLATTLNGAINNSITTITVATGVNIVNYTYLTIVAEGSNTAELIQVVSGGGTTSLTVVRGPGGTGTSAHGNGAQVLVARTIIASCSVITTHQTGNLSMSCTNLTPASTGKDISSLIEAFTASDTPVFDHKRFGCYIPGRQGGKIVLSCAAGSQDNIGWTVMFDPLLVGSAAGCVGGGAPGCVVAAMSTYAKAPARWCVNHTPFVSGPTDLVWTAGKYPDERGIPGDGPYTSNVTAGSLASATGAIAPGVGLCPAGTLRCDTVTVDGEPCDQTPHSGEETASACPKNAAYAFLQNAVVGDLFTLELGGEWLRLADKGAAFSWTLQRGYGHRGTSTHSSTALSAFCSSQDFNYEYTNWSWTWDSAADPHGTNSGGTTIKIAYDYDHPTPYPSQTVGGDANWDPNCVGAAYPCYGARTTGALGDAPNILTAAGPKFAGATGTASYFVLAEDHPGWLQSAASAAEKLWLLDGRPLQPNAQISDTATAVSGQLYKITSTTSDGDNMTLIGGSGADIGVINRKLQPTWAYCGTQPLNDISSAATGNVIGTTSTDSFSYCQTRVAGECRTGSARGDIYVNCPNQVVRDGSGTYGCAGQDSNLTTDICLSNSSAYLNGIAQVGFAANDTVGTLGRTLTNGLAHYKLIDGFWSAQAFADASWVTFRSMYLANTWTGALLAKLPPFPASDGVDRTTFVPVPITISAVGGATNAIVRFGYAENGAATSYYCTTRQEACVANAATVQTIPFQYKLSDGGGAETGITGVSCAAGCVINLPGIPGRMIYSQVVWRNGSNATVQTGSQEVRKVP